MNYPEMLVEQSDHGNPFFKLSPLTLPLSPPEAEEGRGKGEG